MDQIKLYGDKVNWFVDVELMLNREKAMSYAKFVALEAFQYSQFPQQGPVHLNFPYRKPLEPDSMETLSSLREDVLMGFQPVKLFLPLKFPSIDQIQFLRTSLEKARRILVLLGPESDRYLDLDTVSALTGINGVVVSVDPLSGFRYQNLQSIITTMDVLLQLYQIPFPDLIIQIGEMPISRNLSLYLDSYRGDWIVSSSLSKLTDGILGSTTIMKVDPNSLLRQSDFSELELDDEWSNNIKKLNRDLVMKMDLINKYPGSEPKIIRDLVNMMSPNRIWIANSLAVRHFDEFIPVIGHLAKVSSALGVSGIDGTLSSALGTASVEPTLLVTGDLAFYHDMNALLIMQRYKIPLIIIIINNQGGAIFDRLPISNFEMFDEFFYNDHPMSFDKIAEQFGIDHVKIDDPEKMMNNREELERIRKQGRGIIEVHTDGKDQERIRKEIIENLMS
jgi:2-succinyl-5-enolpyruvyl-6-hydroxy-3-cyclohexene-1-carboxylate synthase